MLPTREFAEAGSVSALLLICGTIAGAALPWVLAQEVLRSGPDRHRRRLAVSFCLFATVLQGAGAGLATCLIVSHYARGWVLPASFAAVFISALGDRRNTWRSAAALAAGLTVLGVVVFHYGLHLLLPLFTW